MAADRVMFLASAIVLGTGAFWGFYWLPVRALDEMGLAGAWGTVWIAASAALVLSPWAFARRRQIALCNRVALFSIALGGAAFALYSIGFVHGRVALIILLWFLTPVWSTLIGHYVMRWRTPRLRIVAIVVGLAGLIVMLGADGSVPLPRGVGEWMALIAGMLWSVSTTGIRAKSDLDPAASSFVFAIGATIAALLLALVMDPLPVIPAGDFARAAALALLIGGVWWGASMAALMWATVRLEPARVGILLMTEVVVGAASAAVLAQEHLAPLELVGGGLVLVAGILEIWPERPPARSV